MYFSPHRGLPINVLAQPTKTIYTMTPREHTLAIRSIVAIERLRFMQCYQAYCWDVPSPPQIAYSSGSVEYEHRDASTSTQHSFEVRRLQIIQLLGWRTQSKVHLLPPTTIRAYHHHYTLDDRRILDFIWVGHPSIRLLPPSKLVHHFHPTNWNLRPVPWEILHQTVLPMMAMIREWHCQNTAPVGRHR
jgi:hypothetical protein